MANIDVSRLFFPRKTVGFSCGMHLFLGQNAFVFRAECTLFLERIYIYLIQNEFQSAHLGDLVSVIQFHKVSQRVPLEPNSRPRHPASRNKW